MGIFRAVVLSSSCFMPSRQTELPQGRSIGPKLVGDENTRGRPVGIVTLIERGTRTMGDRYLCWQRHELPRCIRRNAEQSVVSSRDQVTLEVEVIVDGGVNRQKSLR